MQKKISRRSIVKCGFVVAVCAPALGRNASAATPLTPLDPSDPAAAALAYTTDTATVDNKAIPNHAADQKCANCVQYRGTPADAAGGCAIFAGRSVAANGWCKLWASTETSTPE